MVFSIFFPYILKFVFYFFKLIYIFNWKNAF